jgi:hypothetical protein
MVPYLGLRAAERVLGVEGTLRLPTNERCTRAARLPSTALVRM